MADEETREEEPSIEEILDSIRQIISDDDDDDSSDDFDESSSDDNEDDIIELNDPVDEPESVEAAPPPPPPPPKPKPAPEPEEDIFEDIEEDFEPEPAPPPKPKPAPEPDLDSFDIGISDDEDEDHILTGIAESAAMDGFEKLVKKTAVEYNGITIEEIVRSELKPLLREWLDDNLPSMIERLVQEELERVSKRVLGDF